MGGSKQRRKKPVAEPAPLWWIIGGPCAIVVTMIFLGVALRSPADGAQPLDAEPDRNRRPIDLATLATEDAERLTQHSGTWTLQFMVACERESLEPIVDMLDSQPRFFLLDSPDTGTGCYRVCWGWYASKAEAERPRAYPEVLSNIAAMGWARPVDEVLP